MLQLFRGYKMKAAQGFNQQGWTEKIQTQRLAKTCTSFSLSKQLLLFKERSKQQKAALQQVYVWWLPL
jgi:hypothetical protein